MYRQRELIRTETVERMNVLLEECFVDFVELQVIHGQPTTNAFSLVVVVHRISSDFKNHVVLPSFTTFKTGPHLKWCDNVKRVFESVTAALPGKRIAVAIIDNGNNIIKGMRWKNRKMVFVLSAHMLNRVIKSTMKRVSNNNSVVHSLSSPVGRSSYSLHLLNASTSGLESKRGHAVHGLPPVN